MKKNQYLPSAEDHSAPPADSGSLLDRRTVLRLAGAGALCLALPGIPGPAGAAAEGAAQQHRWRQTGTDFADAVFTRRSIREYTGAPLSDEALEQILAAGMSAPSSHNTQPWRFVVLRTPEELQLIPRINSYTNYAVKAGAAIVVCMQKMKGEPDELGLLSVACCAQNMQLAVTAQKLGSVWLQIYPDAEPAAAWRQVLGLPDDVVPVCVIVVGTPASPLPPANRMDPKKIHYGVWKK